MTSEKEECAVGMINGIEQSVIFGADEDTFETLEALLTDREIPSGVTGVVVTVSKFHFEEGQMTFPETGQWDIAPYWEMDMAIKHFEIATDDGIELVEALLEE